MTLTRSLKLAAIVVCLAAGAPGRSEAGFIKYTQTVVASGFLGVDQFTDALVTFTQYADTDNVIKVSNSYMVQATASSISVEGLTTTGFTKPTFVWVDPGTTTPNVGVAGIAQGNAGPIGGPIVFGVYDNPAFLTYDLKTALSTVTGIPLWFQNKAFDTKIGPFIITDVANPTGGATFEAIVPEPSSLALGFVAALIGVGAARGRRKPVA